MNDAQGVRLQLNDIEVRQSSTRQTPMTNFGYLMRRGAGMSINKVGHTVGQITATAGYIVPTAAVVSAAINGAGNLQDTEATGGGMGGAAGSAGYGTAGGADGLGSTPMDAVLRQAKAGNPNAELMAATQQMQEVNQAYNLQYLRLQENMQHENRQFTAVSNVMKSRSDTARNTLSNLK